MYSEAHLLVALPLQPLPLLALVYLFAQGVNIYLQASRGCNFGYELLHVRCSAAARKRQETF